MKYKNTPLLSPRSNIVWTFAICLASFAISISVNAQSVIAPPTIGQETKGTPALAEVSKSETADSTAAPSGSIETEASADRQSKGIDNLLGKATITESKRDSGQRYLIELKHSAGTKQYIEETDSDGKLESTSNDIEETPNLPKWKIGSW